jgi:hypothetical protein
VGAKGILPLLAAATARTSACVMVTTSPLQFSIGAGTPHGNAADAACFEPRKIKPPRVFVGIKVAPELAQILAGTAKQLGNEGVRLVPDHDIHLTLVPPWNESDVVGASEKLRQAICGFGCFSLMFGNLRYGPTGRHPHLLWVECTVAAVLDGGDGVGPVAEETLCSHGGEQRAFRVADGALDRVRSNVPAAVPAHITLVRIPRGGRIIK